MQLIYNRFYKILTLSVFVVFYITTFSSYLIACDDELVDLNLKKLRVHTYTSKFAKRFGLPVLDKNNEPKDGIEAIEFVVKKYTRIPFYYGVIKIYMDNKLPIDYPEKSSSGNNAMLSPVTHFFAQPNEQLSRWSSSDRLYFNKHDMLYDRKAFLISNDLKYEKSIHIEEYHRNLFPNLAYIKIGIGVSMLPKINKVWPLKIWIEKVGGKDYRKSFKLIQSDFLQFELPKQFYKKLFELGQVVNKHNDIIRKNTKR